MRRRVHLVLVLVLLVGLAACRPRPPHPGPGPHHHGRVTISGTAYRFNSRDPIVGATVRVAELPSAVTTTDADGRWSLRIPSGRPVTPFIVATGYHSIHLQTFVAHGRDLREVNFQTPTEDIYQALRALLGARLGREIDTSQCVVVSTISDPRVRAMTFDEFIQFAPHGIAGATASATPSMGAPIYFDDSVLPDPTRTESSGDGGVLWIEVPPGRYVVRATHPDHDFASFLATCEPGRLINANPPWGLFARS